MAELDAMLRMLYGSVDADPEVLGMLAVNGSGDEDALTFDEFLQVVHGRTVVRGGGTVFIVQVWCLAYDLSRVAPRFFAVVTKRPLPWRGEEYVHTAKTLDAPPPRCTGPETSPARPFLYTPAVPTVRYGHAYMFSSSTRWALIRERGSGEKTVVSDVCSLVYSPWLVLRLLVRREKQAVKDNYAVAQPAFELQKAIRRKVLGVKYWEKMTKQRTKMYASYDQVGVVRVR